MKRLLCLRESVQDINFIYHNAGDYITIVTEGGEGICTVAADENVKSCVCVEGMNVEKMHRRKGIGTALLIEAERVAREKMGAKVISLAADKDGFTTGWYERNGYNPIFTEDGYIIMYKSL